MEGPPINYESYDRAENAQYIGIRIAIRPCRIVLYRNTPPAAIPIPSEDPLLLMFTVKTKIYKIYTRIYIKTIQPNYMLDKRLQ